MVEADDIALFTEANGAALADNDPFPVWDWWQTSRVASVEAAGEQVLKFSDVNVQGVNLDSTDLAGKESLTLDLWSEDAGKVKVFLISGTYPNNTEYGVIVELPQVRRVRGRRSRYR